MSRRAVASMATSLALHFVLAAGATTIFLSGTLGVPAPDADPPLVEMVGGEDAVPLAVRAPLAVVTSSHRMRSEVPLTAAPAERVDLAVSATGVQSFATVPEIVPPDGETTAPDAAADTVSSALEEAAVGERLAAGPVVETDQVGIRIEEESSARGDDGASSTGPLAVTPVPAAGWPATPLSHARLQEVTRTPSLSTQAESEAMIARPEVFEFLLDHPDFATHITRALRLARYRIWRTDDGMFIDDGWGTTGQITVVHAGGGTRMLYAKGAFHHKVLPTIPGEAVVTIDYEVRPGEDGRPLVHARLTGQLKIDSAFATLMLKIADSIVREKAATESRRLLQTFAKVLRAIDETPAAVYSSVSANPDVPRRELEQFRLLLGLP